MGRDVRGRRDTETQRRLVGGDARRRREVPAGVGFLVQEFKRGESFGAGVQTWWEFLAQEFKPEWNFWRRSSNLVGEGFVAGVQTWWEFLRRSSNLVGVLAQEFKPEWMFLRRSSNLVGVLVQEFKPGGSFGAGVQPWWEFWRRNSNLVGVF